MAGGDGIELITLRATPIAPAVVTTPRRCHDDPRDNGPRREQHLRHLAGALPDPTEHGQRRHDRLALQRAHVLRGAVRHVLHRAARATERWPPEPTELNLPYATVFTVILVLSSVTCQFGVFAAEHGNVYGLRRWFTITFVMGLIFVLGQVNEYRVLVTEHGTTISSSTYGSVFYLTTGFHGLHVIGGLIAFIFLLIRSTMGRFTPAQATAAIVVSYYWHFVDVVWIGLFAMIYLIR